MGNRNHGSLLKKATSRRAGVPAARGRLAAAGGGRGELHALEYSEVFRVRHGGRGEGLSQSREGSERAGPQRTHRPASGGAGYRRPCGDRGVAGSGRQPKVVQYSRQAAPVLRAEEQKDPRLRRLSAAHDRVDEGAEEGGLVPGASCAAQSEDRSADVPGRSPSGSPQDQGPFRIGHGRLHHARAQEAGKRAPSQRLAVRKVLIRRPFRQTMAGMGHCLGVTSIAALEIATALFAAPNLGRCCWIGERTHFMTGPAARCIFFYARSPR